MSSAPAENLPPTQSNKPFSNPRYTNNTGISLMMALWLANDEYDYDPNTISATKILRPIRQLVLAPRVDQKLSVIDVSSFFKSRMGTAIHAGIQRAWTVPPERLQQLLQMLGMDQLTASQFVVNPEPSQVRPDQIPVYIEQRYYRDIEVGGVTYRISGMVDFVAGGYLHDTKTTSTFTHKLSDKDEDYILQGSIYRWLAPHIITQSTLKIGFAFPDWMPGRAKTDANYPSSPVPDKTYDLMSFAETEAYITNKLRMIQELRDAPEKDIPLCNDKELWRRASEFKYYMPVKKTGEISKRAKATEPSMELLNKRIAEIGPGGLVKEIKGGVMACNYCPAFHACSQKDQLIQQGDLLVQE